METKLKAIRDGNSAAVMKLWTKFEEFKENPDNVEMGEFKVIKDAVTQKKTILHVLNEKMIEFLHEDHTEQDITDSVDYNSSLMPIQTLNSLKAQLEGRAAQTVEGFDFTNGNYLIAVNLLRDWFGQSSKLIHAYMKTRTDK
ncbi:Hypothetical predicted protein [Mytilus galloprovincialis]|uniref:Uncharacterized protein n=1 Tax=Mytilus galloprovincialis TaxID=29158 RepID=A0A8B6CXI3_MYTGA|nr:Hypothetical predicted protein [Mytilus galloprovincialis]